MTPYQEFLERERVRRTSQMKRVLFNQRDQSALAESSNHEIHNREKEMEGLRIMPRSRNPVQGRRLKFCWLDKRLQREVTAQQLHISDADKKRSKTSAGTNTRVSLFPIESLRRKSRLNTNGDCPSTTHTPIHSHRSEQQEKKRSHTERKPTERQQQYGIPQQSFRLLSILSPVTPKKEPSPRNSHLSIEGIKKTQSDVHYGRQYEKLLQSYQGRPYISRKLTGNSRLKEFINIRKKTSFEIAPWELNE